jgi:hypothetical protein
MGGDRAQLDELHRTLVDKLTGLTSGQDWLNWIASARLFHRYSPQNQILLAVQGAQGHVASYRRWQRIPAQDGRLCQVRKGEHGLTILAPLTVTRRDLDDTTGEQTVTGVRGFRPVKVFHQGQLVAPPALREPPQPKLLAGENRWQHVWSTVVAHLTDIGFNVELVNRSPVETWNGRTDFTTGVVLVADHLEPPQRLKTLLHEWAHIALGHADHTATVPRPLLEVEAESAAYLVCTTLALDSSAYTVPYLAHWSSGDTALLERTAQRVLATTATMISTLETQMSINLTPDPLAVAETTVTTGEPTPNEQAGRTQPHTIVDVPSLATADPDIDRARGDLRKALTNLSRSERRLLVDTLDRLDHDLDIATALCADAGLDAAATSRLLIPRGADPADLHRSMTRPVQDHHGDHAPLFPDKPDITPSLAGDHRDRHRHDPASESPRNPAEAILDQWANLASPHPTQTVQT